MCANKNGILPTYDAKQPANLKFLKERINRRRESPSPTRSEYDVAAHKIKIAENESTMAEEVSKLLKDYRIKKYRRATDISVIDFPRDVGFNNGLSAAQAGLIKGLEIPQFDPFPIYEQLGGAAIPHIIPHGLALPHFAGAWKDQESEVKLAELQASYAGATLVYGRDAARLVLEDPDPVGDAHVVTFTSDGQVLHTFACYSSETQGRVLYHQFPITNTFVTASYDEFRRARRQLRNLQDYANEASESLRDELKDKWTSTRHAAEPGTGEEAEGIGAPGRGAQGLERGRERGGALGCWRGRRRRTESRRGGRDQTTERREA